MSNLNSFEDPQTHSAGVSVQICMHARKLKPDSQHMCVHIQECVTFNPPVLHPAAQCRHISTWSIASLGLDPPNYLVFILLLFPPLPQPSLSPNQLPFCVGGNACWVMRDSGHTNLSLIALKGHSLTQTLTLSGAHTDTHVCPRTSCHWERRSDRKREWTRALMEAVGKREESDRSVCVCVGGGVW